MNVGQYKLLVSKNFETVTEDLFLELAAGYDDDRPIDSALLAAIKKTVEAEWHSEVSQMSVWGSNLLGFMKALLDARVLDDQVRSILVYPFLCKEFDSDGRSPFSIDDCLGILIYCGRLTGYPDASEVNYPLSRVNQALTIGRLTKNGGELNKNQLRMTCFAVMHYLLHQLCTPSQRSLIQIAIQFRPHLTREECLAESLILRFLLENSSTCRAFFSEHACHIDMRFLVSESRLLPFQRLIPQKNRLVDCISLHAISHQFKQNYERLAERSLRQLQAKTIETIFQRVAETPSNVLALADVLLNDSYRMNPLQQAFFQRVVLLYCLRNYIGVRRGQTNHSFFSFAGTTKINAAQKMLQELNHEWVDWTVKEQLASREGRLGDIRERLKRHQHSLYYGCRLRALDMISSVDSLDDDEEMDSDFGVSGGF